jgi:hypothetical protein
MSEESVNVRIESLEESRRDQGAMIRGITEALHRIELSISSLVGKQCPVPGKCLTLETDFRTEMSNKWALDKIRFEGLEKRATENEAWHRQMELDMNKKLDDIKKEHAKTQTILTRGSGAMALLIFIMPVLIWALQHYTKS